MQKSYGTTSLQRRANRNPKRVKKNRVDKPYRIKFYTPAFVSMGKQPFPKMLSNTVKFCETVSVTLVAGYKSVQYSCNGLYDLRAAAGGAQPLYFDQLVDIYNHYTVLRSRIRVTPIMDYSGINTACIQAIYIDDDTSVVASAQNAIERATGKGSRVLAASPPNPASLYCTWSAKNAFGPGTLADSTMQGNSSSNPTEQEYFTYILQDPNNAATFTCSLLVECEYDTIWDEYRTITGS